MDIKDLGIPEKCSGRATNGLTSRIREHLLAAGDKFAVSSEKERNQAYQRAIQIGIKVVSRKMKDGTIFIYRVN